MLGGRAESQCAGKAMLYLPYAECILAHVCGLDLDLGETRPLVILQAYIDDSRMQNRTLVLAGTA
jgi:hypothetical protein